jgi:hypothetical protein
MAHINMNRRIGARTDVRIPVTLRTESARGLFTRRPRHVEAVVLNASVSGIVVDCHPLPGVGLRDHLLVTAHEGRATVEVRRIETIEQDRVHYGLLLLESDEAFDTAMHDIAGTLGAESADWRWQFAR